MSETDLKKIFKKVFKQEKYVDQQERIWKS